MTTFELVEGPDSQTDQDKTQQKLEEIRQRAAARTPGKWRWFGNVKTRTIHLATEQFGRLYVLGFKRWGLQGAQPVFAKREGTNGGILFPATEFGEPDHNGDFTLDHPDAISIQEAPTDVDFLLGLVDDMAASMRELERIALESAQGDRVKLDKLTDERDRLREFYDELLDKHQKLRDLNSRLEADNAVLRHQNSVEVDGVKYGEGMIRATLVENAELRQNKDRLEEAIDSVESCAALGAVNRQAPSDGLQVCPLQSAIDDAREN